MKIITAITTVVLLSLSLAVTASTASAAAPVVKKPVIGATTLKEYSFLKGQLYLRVKTNVTGATKVVVAAAYRTPQTARSFGSTGRVGELGYVGDWLISDAWAKANQGKVQPVRVTASNKAGTTIKTFSFRLPSCAKNGCAFPILPSLVGV